MRVRGGVAGAIVGVLAAALLGGAPASAAPAGSGRVSSVVTTVPLVAGITFTVAGSSYRSDARGRVVLPLLPDVPLPEQVQVRGAQVRPDVRASFGRWYGRVRSNNVKATIGFSYRVRLEFSGPPGADLAPGSISLVELKSSTGELIRLRGDERTKPLWVPGTRVVALGGGLESKDVEYSVATVQVRGADVVNRGEQRFAPRTAPVFGIKTLWYKVRFTSRDLLFNTAIGSAVVLTYPDGSADRIPLEHGGEVTVDALPRGNYKVKVDAPGTSFERPLSLSKDQTVDLDVLSYVDVALGVLVFVGIAIGLFLLGRGRGRLGRLRRRRDRIPPDELHAEVDRGEHAFVSDEPDRKVEP